MECQPINFNRPGLQNMQCTSGANGKCRNIFLGTLVSVQRFYVNMREYVCVTQAGSRCRDVAWPKVESGKRVQA